MTSIINGQVGPNSLHQAGGYGANAGHNVKQYLTQPGQGQKPGMSDMQDILKDLPDIMSGNVDPQDLMEKMQGKMPGNMAPKSVPDIQYTTDDAVFGFQKSHYQDTLAFSSEMLELGNGGGSANPADQFKQQHEALKSKLGPILGLAKNIPGFGDIVSQVEDALNMDPNDLLEQMGGNSMLGGLGNMAKPNIGLDKDLIDRNQDGQISVAEKAAETLLLDDSANALKAEVSSKMAGIDILDFDKTAVLTRLQDDLAPEASAFDGKITVKERKTAQKLAEDKDGAQVVGAALDKIMIDHDLDNKAQSFQSGN